MEGRKQRTKNKKRIKFGVLSRLSFTIDVIAYIHTYIFLCSEVTRGLYYSVRVCVYILYIYIWKWE